LSGTSCADIDRPRTVAPDAGNRQEGDHKRRPYLRHTLVCALEDRHVGLYPIRSAWIARSRP